MLYNCVVYNIQPTPIPSDTSLLKVSAQLFFIVYVPEKNISVCSNHDNSYLMNNIYHVAVYNHLCVVYTRDVVDV